jgi:HEAT repeat protein
MAAAVTKICDPELYGQHEAILLAKAGAEASPGFEIEIVRFLQAQCLSNRVHLPTVFRGLEVLGGMLDGARLLTLLRPFLRSSDPQIASKCVLVLGRQSSSMAWLNGVMAESDDRIRANLIESLWKRTEPEVELVLRNAFKDSHPRVAANAVYGLYLLGIDVWLDGLERLVASDDAALRKSGVWVIKSSGVPDAPARLKLLIRDADADVRHAAFDALIHLRDSSKNLSSMEVPAVA